MNKRYDIIGDIHGHVDALVALLKKMGYEERSGTWMRSDRLSTFKEVAHIWVCDAYHHEKHHALGLPPETMWKLNVRMDDIRFPSDRESLDIVMGRPYQRSLTHKGIIFENLYYGSEALHQLRHLYGDTLAFLGSNRPRPFFKNGLGTRWPRTSNAPHPRQNSLHRTAPIRVSGS